MMNKRIILFLTIILTMLSVNPPVAYAALRASEYEKYCTQAVSPFKRIFINDNSAASVNTFAQAVSAQRPIISAATTTIVCLREVALDLTNAPQPIRVLGNTRILGTRSPQNSGSALYITSNAKRNLLELVGDNIVINGLRIIGNDFSIANATATKGIFVNSQLEIDIGNLEMAGWGVAAIDIRDEKNRINMDNYSKVNIHDSYFHHNQNGHFGYGVVLGQSAYAFIQTNVFDQNRHAIAADGEKGTGYFAYYNLILKGGGKALHDFFKPTHTHQLDMHGTAGGSSGTGGNAGERVLLGGNTIQYSTGNGYYIRGTPKYKTEAYNNFFAQKYYAGGIVLDGAFASIDAPYSKYIISSNTSINYDTYGQYKICDIDKDGKDDLMQPAGATWWYSSGAKMPWQFIKHTYIGFNQIITNTNIDNDGYCDLLFNSDNSLYYYSPGANKETQLTSNMLPTIEKDIRLGDFDGDGYKDFFKTQNEQWSYFSTRTKTWTNIQTSSHSLNNLVLGDFNGDKKTDVLVKGSNSWNVSWSGTSSWQRLNNILSSDMQSLKVADVNGDGQDDIVLINLTDRYGTDALGRPQIIGYDIKTYTSLSGRTGWLNKSHYMPFKEGWEGSQPLKYFIGKFDSNAGADLLVIDTLRNGYISSGFTATLQKYSEFNY